MTRIPTLYAHQRALDAMAQRRSALTNDQLQLSTGKRVNDPSDDPLAAAQAERLRSQLARISIENRMIGFARQMLSTADSTLGQVSDSLQFARESLVSAGNGAMSPADRALIAQQLSGVRDQLVSLANSRDGAGGYVFGGQGATSAPFDASSGEPVAPAPPPAAQGSHPGEQYTGLDAKYTTSQDGRAIFADAAGNTLFAALDTIVGVLGNASASAADVDAALSTATDALDGGLERVLMARTRAGEQLRAIDAHESALANGDLDAREPLSDLVDLDYAAAISNFQNNRTALDAAMATYAQIARLSLFDYL
ncbi:MAG: flagellar hook-associated protein FlgL [Burkholderiaceae bacterium]|jgi:flagellar hook-associated protein 3 FlgL|nr:flagellar hook-associated protein FlgL [Burkholderiaceae bacterium]